jgi:ABC-2 type transport system permease protein
MAAINIPVPTGGPIDPSIARLRSAGPPTGLARARRAVRDGWLIAGRDMAQWVREPQMIVWGLVMPIMFVVLFAYVLGSAMVVPGGGSYQAFVMPGMFVQTMAFGIGETLASVQADSSKGVMDRFRSMPMAPSAIVVGRCLANMIYSVVSLAIMVLAGFAVGWRWEGTVAEAFAAFGLLLLLRMAFLWIGIFLGLMATSAEMANSIYGLLYPLTMLSNAFVATALLPVWLGVIAEWNPLSATVTATRELFGNPTGDPTSWVSEHALQLAVLWPLVITAVTLPLAVRAYQKLSR